ncbi:winged helix-turn-helix domain-containing protein [Haloferax marinisediminis]|uniref:winged helix-turn-helix domain-containing protein n=1 Tax=Haloferax marinisediminis TaxID=2666142 RepID=UPI002B4134C8|nr:helix-turn-helix domain-containing protein [Haloferax marinisediminis]
MDSDSEQAFSLLADETRLAILRVLADSPNEPLTFSELRERVGVPDSGRFNYHLGKLTGRFVKKSDAGYEIRLAGWNIVGAILGGAYTRGDDIGPVPVDPPCPACDGQVEATYVDEHVTVRCADCDKTILDAGIPPGVLEGYDDASFPEVAERFVLSLFSQARDGFCASCRGRMEPRLVTNTDELAPSDVCEEAQAIYSCTRCREELIAGIGMAFLDHPAVVSFYYDHGVDLSQPNLWGTAWRDKPTLTVVSDDPLRATVDFVVDEDTLTLVIDETLAVHDVERSPAS